MSNYHRRKVPGGTYFFTARLQDRQSDLLVSHIDVLRHATGLAMRRWPFVIEAAVILPSTLHMIWTLPAGDADYSKRWRVLKTGFSRNVAAPEHIPASHARRGEKGIWQRRFWEHLIRDEDDMAMHMHVIRSAPIHAGLARRHGEWPYSSFFAGRKAGPRTIAPVPSSPNPAAAAMSS